VAILTLLFVVQRRGTHVVGRLFGPVMVVWFAVIALIALPEIVRHPDVLRALSPTFVLTFLADHPYVSFVAMGAVVLAITGAEALYADMGHFGRPAIRRAWFAVVFPALTLNYLGQGALILHDRAAVVSPFFVLTPGWARVPMVVLATAATVIASQAVISGAFSVSRQAMRLGYLPQLTIRHTSDAEGGQIYVPGVNWLLFGGVVLLMLAFRSSQRLATAYGLAVTGTLVLTTTLFLILAGRVWHWPRYRLIAAGIVFGGLELMFLAANLTKVVKGGWLPLVIAAAVITVMTTWQRGRVLVTERRVALEGPLSDFVEGVRADPPTRVPGVAVFPHPTGETVPLALRANLDFNHVLHEQILIVSVVYENVPHVGPDERLSVDDLGYADDGLSHVTLRFGFQDEQDVPAALAGVSESDPELDLGGVPVSYFLSRIAIERGREPGMPAWRKRLFIAIAHNAANPAVYFQLPVSRTVVMGTTVRL
jgi:KUP system potassium uptake protein